MDPQWRGDYRPSGVFRHLRTVCHGCRQVSHVHVDGEDEMPKLRPMIVPGDGSVAVDVSPGYLVQAPCPVCGDSDDPGWLPGLRPPV